MKLFYFILKTRMEEIMVENLTKEGFKCKTLIGTNSYLTLLPILAGTLK